jgi:endonuclease YncB( thermonuclease family)
LRRLSPPIRPNAGKPIGQDPIGRFLGKAGGAIAPSGRVLSVTDGDTVRVRFKGHKHDVRLIGIDTPEEPWAIAHQLGHADHGHSE